MSERINYRSGSSALARANREDRPRLPLFAWVIGGDGDMAILSPLIKP